VTRVIDTRKSVTGDVSDMPGVCEAPGGAATSELTTLMNYS
jgi:hypothetical protein